MLLSSFGHALGYLSKFVVARKFSKRSFITVRGLSCGWNAGVGFFGFDCSSSYHVAFTRLFDYLHEALLGFGGILNGLWMKG